MLVQKKKKDKLLTFFFFSLHLTSAKGCKYRCHVRLAFTMSLRLSGPRRPPFHRQQRCRDDEFENTFLPFGRKAPLGHQNMPLLYVRVVQRLPRVFPWDVKRNPSINFTRHVTWLNPRFVLIVASAYSSVHRCHRRHHVHPDFATTARRRPLPTILNLPSSS